MTEQEKYFINLQKLFFELQKELKKYKMVGHNPPDCLLKKYEEAERELNYLSQALDKSLNLKC